MEQSTGEISAVRMLPMIKHNNVFFSYSAANYNCYALSLFNGEYNGKGKWFKHLIGTEKQTYATKYKINSEVKLLVYTHYLWFGSRATTCM